MQFCLVWNIENSLVGTTKSRHMEESHVSRTLLFIDVAYVLWYCGGLGLKDDDRHLTLSGTALGRVDALSGTLDSGQSTSPRCAPSQLRAVIRRRAPGARVISRIRPRRWSSGRIPFCFAAKTLRGGETSG